MPSFQDLLVRIHNQRTVDEDVPRKMTCRTPSSASSHSTHSHSSSSSTFSSLSTGSTSSAASDDGWQKDIEIREIYKSGKLKLIPLEKRIFTRQREKAYYCLFCIHDESRPFWSCTRITGVPYRMSHCG
ncbi:uncharacterized protein LOC129601772 [Paramacrobiotus metropolitanus]|uniref:uncharacterized protein LOC129601772 n=1 Tax=Paramacrobiotus metropolitanus TaxID=2943436 RepID=UPI002445DFB2|nr:uncharacterized protein LOC129601772 [Paramacrobiotus metropolitanus]